MRCGFDTFWRWVQVLGQKKVLQIENIVMTLAFSLCNKWTQVRKEKLRQDGQRKKSKTGCDSERKSFINFISSFTASSCVPTPHQKSIWREPAYLPQPQITKAEAERTHTKHMDIVKKEKIYKGAETLFAERQSGRLRNPLSPRLFSEDGSKKKMLLREEISDFETVC